MDNLLARMTGAMDPQRHWGRYLLAASCALALGIVLLRPDVSRGLSDGARVVFWLAHVGLGMALLETTQVLLGRSGMVRHLPPALHVLSAGVIGAVLFALFSTLLLEQWLLRVGWQVEPTALTPRALMEEFRDSAGQVILFWMLLNAPRLILIGRQQPAQPAPPTMPDGLAELVARLPRHLGVDITAMSAELHYLRVYTPRGEALILMSFGRAVAALDGQDGMVVHRSHWVALPHVAALETSGAQLLCRMDTGLSVPVSRKNRPALRQALAARDLQRLAEL